jgi:DNA repair exonuclease SbcCD ATPase subunit
MKLQELAVISPTKQAAAVFESYFGTSIKFDTISRRQAQSLLNRVRSLISEHRRTPAFHKSEQDPAYLKLVMLEQALATQAVTGQPAANPQQQAALQTAQMAQNKRAIQDQIKQKQQEIQQLQQQMNNPVMAAESRASLRKRLQESEVQQAQVVLASQDMVDQVQKMLEQVSAMQFKDLPALVDQVKNQVGVDQAMQFNTDASAALTGMIQNLQASKQQLEGALGVVTGQAPVVPGEEMGVEMPDTGEEVPAELPAPDGEEDLDAEMDANLGVPAASLGRGRR